MITAEKIVGAVLHERPLIDAYLAASMALAEFERNHAARYHEHVRDGLKERAKFAAGEFDEPVPTKVLQSIDDAAPGALGLPLWAANLLEPESKTRFNALTEDYFKTYDQATRALCLAGLVGWPSQTERKRNTARQYFSDAVLHALREHHVEGEVAPDTITPITDAVTTLAESGFFLMPDVVTVTPSSAAPTKGANPT